MSARDENEEKTARLKNQAGRLLIRHKSVRVAANISAVLYST
ncbi:hypothetical protein GbCGDNIH2_7038 [Granulibacter bethesdensis]|uniref:Uncharacterized protein n=1 Tax=Granulibacter bethesdensis (strain ATCC BAA-1260 / CGDNIH1) TaxID=391165 RepID=A0A286M2X0_GRABC|nr:hypothetical protein GbCGDNIH2_7038 [Granulibacter bethesdensis]APH51204.1 hypothetical protein GbCGDNIH5_7038 [Granulibacter bethesdensis]APH63898.1 hypothetical protein GbCGDNIH1I4_7038 [Granulibacter bethesdensis]ASV62369.1 hypothetical protein GbCGDNIH1_7038 [Granulibacter bethesdensis CGDNIH1]